MILLVSVLLCFMVRYMIDMLFGALWYTFRLNHIRTELPGWKLEVIKFILTVMLVSPIIGSLMMAELTV